MFLKENHSLQPYNSFGIDVSAALFAELHHVDDLYNAISNGLLNRNHLLLGGGTNVLFTKDFEGVVLQNNIKGISIESETDDHVLITANAGEQWHHLVMFCVERNWGGIENLSLIPGTVGAAPMQNIGAYGVELKQVFHSLSAINLETGQLHSFDQDACKFGYRQSVFKHELKGKYFIHTVSIRLQKKPAVNISYGAIKTVLAESGITEPSIKDVSNAVMSIRQTKLPDPALLGNAGSFFKNPEIEMNLFEAIKIEFPQMPGYPLSEKLTKVPAGWLIEQCGWKGKRVGNTGAHKDQALVLVNYGGATGNEIYELAMQIKKSVKDKFGIEIQPEVNII